MSERDPQSEGTSVWAAGLRLVGRRELAPEERMEIRRAAMTFAALACGSALVLPLIFLSLLLTVALGGRLDAPVSPLTAAVVLLLLALGSVLGYGMLRWVRWSRMLARDAHQGHAELFEGEVDSHQILSATTRRLVRSGLLRGSGSAPEEDPEQVEVLPRSNLVWKVNGDRPRSWIQAQIRRVADVPAFAAVAAEWLDRVSEDDSSPLHIGHRELSSAERTELNELAQRVVLKPALLATVLLAWLGGVLGYLATHGEHAPGHPPSTLVGLSVLTAVSLANVMRNAGLSLQFRRDITFGRVIITRSARFDPENPEPETPNLSPPEEFLPASRVMWSRAGQPAPWRTMVQG